MRRKTPALASRNSPTGEKKFVHTASSDTGDKCQWFEEGQQKYGHGCDWSHGAREIRCLQRDVF